MNRDDPNTDWRRLAACSDMDPAVFFPDEHEPGVPPTAAAACSICPVRHQCLDTGLANGHGVWGGVRLDQPAADVPAAPLAAKQPLLLHLRADSGALSITELARIIGANPRTVWGNLQVLVDDGLVERVPQNNPRPDLYRATAEPATTKARTRRRRTRIRRRRQCAGQLTFDLEQSA